MKSLMFPLVLLSCATPVFAQSRVYTNADLARPLVLNRTPTVEEMQGVLDRQFRLPARKAEPKAIVLPFDPLWPFTYAQRLEPDPWRTPGGLPLYGVWPFFGSYLLNPMAIPPPPLPFAACYDRASDLRGATRCGAGFHRGHGNP